MTASTSERSPVAAERTVLALNEAMTGVYAAAREGHRERLLAEFPVLLALFDGAGGRMSLRVPGSAVRQAPPVPVEYRFLKSLAHSAVAVHEVAGSPTGGGHLSAAGLTTVLEEASAALSEVRLGPAARVAAEAVLDAGRGFLSVPRGSREADPGELEAFGRACAPHVVTLIEEAAGVQVAHWMGVLEEWRAVVGRASWERLHAAVNTLYVTRRKNVLFTVLAQFMGEEAFGDRLLLFETPEFTTTEDRMLDALTRVVADRGLGRSFFRHGRVMDVEIMGDAAARAVLREGARRGMAPVLPSSAPFDARHWPWPTEPTGGVLPGDLRTAAGLGDAFAGSPG
ncbi:hypothetical protein ACN20G_27875 (plasmid) [Streptomyces sp. BI20]|uniref:hypothetical protein n=1 Tax=Streptomyces sp. BI20 TaxID=3403460 RepID=UPI003C7704B7